MTRAVPSPAALARTTRARLGAAADPAVAAGMRAYFKKYEPVQFLGVKTPARRHLVREWYSLVRETWTIEQAMDFCDRLMHEPCFESKSVGLDVLSRFHRSFPREVVRQCRRWLEADLAADWATTDQMSGTILAPALARHPGAVAEVARWTTARNPWVRRASAVSLVPFARKGRYLDEAYGTATRLLEAPEDLLHKAVGWLLREAGRHDRARLEAYLLAEGPRVPRTAIRYALEHFPAPARARVMRETRSGARPSGRRRAGPERSG